MEAIAVVGSVLAVASPVYHFYTKFLYKKEKRTIYKMIRKGLEVLDFDMVAKWAMKLKAFDDKHFDIINDRMERKIWEKIRRLDRVAKMDKVEELFNVSKEVILDATKLKKQFDNDKMMEKGRVMLGKIEEEEQKESETLQELKLDLNKIKRRQIAQANMERTILDSFNLTDKINQLHQDYEKLFVEKFEKEHDIQNILQRDMKKRMLLKKMKKMENNKKPSKSKASC